MYSLWAGENFPCLLASLRNSSEKDQQSCLRSVPCKSLPFNRQPSSRAQRDCWVCRQCFRQGGVPKCYLLYYRAIHWHTGVYPVYTQWWACSQTFLKVSWNVYPFTLKHWKAAVCITLLHLSKEASLPCSHVRVVEGGILIVRLHGTQRRVNHGWPCYSFGEGALTLQKWAGISECTLCDAGRKRPQYLVQELCSFLRAFVGPCKAN